MRIGVALSHRSLTRWADPCDFRLWNIVECSHDLGRRQRLRHEPCARVPRYHQPCTDGVGDRLTGRCIIDVIRARTLNSTRVG